jgi:hypothetical protein
MQSDHPHSSVPTPSAVKNCRKCGQSKPVELFPRGRSSGMADGIPASNVTGNICGFCDWQKVGARSGTSIPFGTRFLRG